MRGQVFGSPARSCQATTACCERIIQGPQALTCSSHWQRRVSQSKLLDPNKFQWKALQTSSAAKEGRGRHACRWLTSRGLQAKNRRSSIGGLRPCHVCCGSPRSLLDRGNARLGVRRRCVRMMRRIGDPGRKARNSWDTRACPTHTTHVVKRQTAGQRSLLAVPAWKLPGAAHQ
jgi:hypothetical protein